MYHHVIILWLHSMFVLSSLTAMLDVLLSCFSVPPRSASLSETRLRMAHVIVAADIFSRGCVMQFTQDFSLMLDIIITALMR